jgi:hypothetical protein
MRTLSITLLFCMGLISSSTAELYANLKVTYSTEKVADRAYDDLATYHWKSVDKAVAGDLLGLSKKLKVNTETEGGFTEFHLISEILRRGWSLKAVEASPPYFSHVDNRKLYRERTRVFHFTRPDPADDAPSTKKGEQAADGDAEPAS